MDFSVYIIQSETSGRHYCGYSSDVERRLREHNDPNYRLSKTTKRFKGPWKLIFTKSCSTRGTAMELEKKIKKRGIARYLQAQSKEQSGNLGLLVNTPHGISAQTSIIRDLNPE